MISRMVNRALNRQHLSPRSNSCRSVLGQGPRSRPSNSSHWRRYTQSSTQVPSETSGFFPNEEAEAHFLGLGYDPTSFWEQPIVWGDQDAFQHVNNVRYVRFFESGRIKWMQSIAHELGGPSKAQAMASAKGVSLILKSIQVKFKRPVTFPDTLLIAHRPHDPVPAGFPSSLTQFNLQAAAYSYVQRAIVCESDCALVWYDYDRLKKCNPEKGMKEILIRRMKDSELRASSKKEY